MRIFALNAKIFVWRIKSLCSKVNNRFRSVCKVTKKWFVEGILPFLGYHHILMILIAIAIILLCKSTFQIF